MSNMFNSCSTYAIVFCVERDANERGRGKFKIDGREHRSLRNHFSQFNDKLIVDRDHSYSRRAMRCQILTDI